MSRPARDFSWHLVALALVVAGLGILAPLAWFQTREPGAPKDSALRDRAARTVAPVHIQPAPVTEELPPLEPQLAMLRPPVADQINLDPSINETPPLPTGPSSLADQQIMGEPRGELRLSATINKAAEPQVPDLTDLITLRQPAEPPSLSPKSALPEIPPVAKAWPMPSGLIEQLNALAAAVPLAAS